MSKYLNKSTAKEYSLHPPLPRIPLMTDEVLREIALV